MIKKILNFGVVRTMIYISAIVLLVFYPILLLRIDQAPEGLNIYAVGIVIGFLLASFINAAVNAEEAKFRNKIRQESMDEFKKRREELIPNVLSAIKKFNENNKKGIDR